MYVRVQWSSTSVVDCIEEVNRALRVASRGNVQIFQRSAYTPETANDPSFRARRRIFQQEIR